MKSFWRWVCVDFKAHPIRFCFEILAWFLSVGCAITMAVTVPNPPLLFMYFAWITSCIIFACAAWQRKAFGILANYTILTIIDVVGLIRLTIATY